MQVDPVAEWRRLSEHYRQMSNAALQELALDYADLTETAQQTLTAELRHRGLPTPGSVSAAPPAKNEPAPPPIELDDSENEEEDTGETVDYTWKTVLCECQEWDQVWQLREMLRRAEIETWYEGPGSIGDGGLLYPRILVAADQLDEARIIIAGPIPQDVIDESRITEPEFEPPVCPSCRAEDPVLESADPVNTWRCESCGRQWSEPQGDPALNSGMEPRKA